MSHSPSSTSVLAADPGLGTDTTVPSLGPRRNGVGTDEVVALAHDTRPAGSRETGGLGLDGTCRPPPGWSTPSRPVHGWHPVPMASPDHPNHSPGAAASAGSAAPSPGGDAVIWRRPEDVPAGLGPTAVTIGVFDGVHVGHQVLLGAVAAAAEEEGLVPVVVTFDPHPMSVVRAGAAPALLCTCERRLELLGQAGMAGVVVLPFTPERAAQTAADFVADVLVDRLAARHVLVGRNFRFGHRAQGDVALLGELGSSAGFRVTVLDLADTAGHGAGASRTEGGGNAGGGTADTAPGSRHHAAGAGAAPAVSSTRIRALLDQGDVASAARLLGRRHRLTGLVVRGEARGRDLGFPTANLAVPDELLVPADGVYAAWMRASGDPGQWLQSAVSIGTNPTFGGVARHVEAYALDVGPDYEIYGQVVDLDLVDRLREMARFDSVDELVTQMVLDVEAAREVLASAPARTGR